MAFGDRRLVRPHSTNSALVCYCNDEPVQTTVTPPHDLNDMKNIVVALGCSWFAQKLIWLLTANYVFDFRDEHGLN